MTNDRDAMRGHAARNAELVIALLAAMIVATAYASPAPMTWTAEVKNSDAHLSEQQRGFLHAAIERLQRGIPEVAENARVLAVALHGEAGQSMEPRGSSAVALARDLARIMDDDPEMTSITFTTGDFLAPVSVTRDEVKTVAVTNFEMREPGLREQVGFFPEGPQTSIEDLPGYPRSQFVVATRGSGQMRIRIPCVSNGYYLGDLITEYRLT